MDWFRHAIIACQLTQSVPCTTLFSYSWKWKEAILFVKLSLIQISELNNRPTVRNLIKANSRTSLLIDHKCRQSFIDTDVFLSPTLLWMLIDAVVGFDQHTHTHTHTLARSLSLRYLAFFPLLSVLHKNLLADYLIINWSTDFNVLACSHFKGNINTKKQLP
jgi:hypothetical protein